MALGGKKKTLRVENSPKMYILLTLLFKRALQISWREKNKEEVNT